MKSRKSVYIFLTIFASVIIMAYFILQLNNQYDYDQNHIPLKFGDNFISMVEGNKDIGFNIFGVQKVASTDDSLKESVTSIAFNNSNIEVIDFQIDEGMVYQDHKLINIMVTAHVLSDKMESADQLLIQMGHEDVKAYPFGKLTIQKNELDQTQHLEPSSAYTVAYPSLSLDVRVKNKTDKPISFLSIYDLTEEIQYEFKEPLTINANEFKELKINDFHLNSKQIPDFITISPILSYTLENRKYEYSMNGVLYGVLDSDKDKIKKMID